MGGVPNPVAELQDLLVRARFRRLAHQLKVWALEMRKPWFFFFWQAASDREHSVETPFLVAESGRLTNGVIDLLFKDSDGWQIIDYKTDLEMSDTAYQQQIDAYRHALRKIGCDVVDAAVVSVRSQK